MTTSEYERIVTAYADMITRICVLRMGNLHDAKDCFQNVFLKLYTRAPAFEDSEHCKAWLIRVAVNECNSARRGFWNRNRVSLSEVLSLSSDLQPDGVLTEILRLPGKYRDVLYLHYYEGYNIAETARLLDLNANTVKTRLFRAREMLKGVLYEQSVSEA